MLRANIGLWTRPLLTTQRLLQHECEVPSITNKLCAGALRNAGTVSGMIG